MVSPHGLPVTKRLARVQKYNFISEKKNTNIEHKKKNKKTFNVFRSLLKRRRRKKTRSKRISKTLRRIKALWEYCMQRFHFHILRSLSHGEGVWF